MRKSTAGADKPIKREVFRDDTQGMTKSTHEACYEGLIVQDFRSYIKQSREHEAILQCVTDVLRREFNRAGSNRDTLDVLSVGSGGGEVDVQMLTELQSELPDVPITAEIVEGSDELVSYFRALLARTPNLQKIPFAWHPMTSAEYISQVKATGNPKKFDLIHMIQMIYYVDDLVGTISFYHRLLKDDGRLLIVLAAQNSGTNILRQAYAGYFPETHSSAGVISCLQNLGLRYEEHLITNSTDITECFRPSSQRGERMLSLMTGTKHFQESFTLEVREAILRILRQKCSTETDGKTCYNSDLTCIVVYS